MSRPVRIDSITGILSFLEAVDWSDPWLWGLAAFHFVVGFSTCGSVLLKVHNLQIALFCIYLMIVYLSEYINEWAAQNYKIFSREQYFDDGGLFISLLLSVPLLLNSVAILVTWMFQAYDMLIRVKRAKLKYNAGKEKEQKNKAEGQNRVEEWLGKQEPTENGNKQGHKEKDD